VNKKSEPPPSRLEILYPSSFLTNSPRPFFAVLFRSLSNARSFVRTTTTNKKPKQYRDGFVVDDGPYRRLDDPANANFLRALAMGVTPRELVDESMGGNKNVVVGLVDKRSEEYVEEFRSFSGQGTSLGSATTASTDDPTVFVPSQLPPPSEAAAGSATTTTTAIQVRLANGQRRVVRVPLTATVADVAARVVHGDGGDGGEQQEEASNFQLLFGFPPKPLDGTVTVQDAGLKGAQVSMKKA